MALESRVPSAGATGQAGQAGFRGSGFRGLRVKGSVQSDE